MIGVDTTFLVQLELLEMPANRAAHDYLVREIFETGAPLALAPQVLMEFVHVVTDQRRFQKPLTPGEALSRAQFWWNAIEVQHVFPGADSMRLFFEWMRQYQLGRKRILDTQLAATLWASGVRRLLTSNPADFRQFGFDLVTP